MGLLKLANGSDFAGRGGFAAGGDAVELKPRPPKALSRPPKLDC